MVTILYDYYIDLLHRSLPANRPRAMLCTHLLFDPSRASLLHLRRSLCARIPTRTLSHISAYRQCSIQNYAYFNSNKEGWKDNENRTIQRFPFVFFRNIISSSRGDIKECREREATRFLLSNGTAVQSYRSQRSGQENPPSNPSWHREEPHRLASLYTSW